MARGPCFTAKVSSPHLVQQQSSHLFPNPWEPQSTCYVSLFSLEQPHELECKRLVIYSQGLPLLSELGNSDWNKWKREGIVPKTEKQQAFSAVALLPSWHGKKLLQIINSLNRNQKEKKNKRRDRIFNQRFEKLGERDCLKSIPVFSPIIVPSLSGSRGLQVQVTGYQVRHWRRNVE